jgi:SNF2 family DNA or RNA helicase
VGLSRRKSKQESKDKKPKKSKKSKKSKGKGKGKANELRLADLKKLSTRNAGAKKKYLRELRKGFVSSAKVDKMMDLLTEVVETADDGEKVLIFSQWTSLLDFAEVPIEGKGWGYRRYDGSMNAKMRGDAVDDFKDPRKDVRIMLVSLKAGNAGLNLNVASRVIILDPFWNPYVEEQAIDRAHRIGQSRPVKVHRVLVPSTVEDRIIELQEKKRALIEEALDEKEHQSISRLGVQELAYLFGVTRNAGERVQYQERRRER